MGRPDFQNLHVYKAAEELADEVRKIVLTWQPLARNTVGIQLARAADSVGANMAEGTGRTTYPDNRRFAGMARGSLYETIHWLRRAYKRQLLKPEQVDRLTQMTDQLAPRLNAYLKSIGKRPTSQDKPFNDR